MPNTHHPTSKETPLHTSQSARRRATLSLAFLTPAITLLMLLIPAYSHAEESNPNNYQCAGHVTAGKAEAGSSEQQVQYTIACSGPISGYAIQTQAPVQTTGFESAPLVTNQKGEAVTTDSFSCNGEIPGFGFNCVGNTTKAFETITGQFAIGSKLCVASRVDPHLTVTYAYLNEKKVITQAISGPFDLGRPHGCPAAAKAAKKGKHHAKGGSSKHGKASKGK
jgi:hypothetical protein